MATWAWARSICALSALGLPGAAEQRPGIVEVPVAEFPYRPLIWARTVGDRPGQVQQARWHERRLEDSHVGIGQDQHRRHDLLAQGDGDILDHQHRLLHVNCAR